MKMKQFELRVNGLTLFNHTHFNACIGQAKYYYRHSGVRGSFMIYDNINRVYSNINQKTLEIER